MSEEAYMNAISVCFEFLLGHKFPSDKNKFPVFMTNRRHWKIGLNCTLFHTCSIVVKKELVKWVGI